VQRLRQNLFLKLVSLACATGLFLYVRKAESTESGHIQVPLTFATDQDVQVVEPDVPRTVDVILRGPAELVQHVRAGQITARVDLHGRRTMPAQTVPVQVELAPELRDRNVHAEYSPLSVKVRLDEVITRYVQVGARIDAQPPPGQAFGVPEVHPATVSVTGLREIVDKIKQVRAVVTEASGKGAVDVLARVSVTDGAGTELRDRLQIQPVSVKVHIPMEREIWTKTGVYVDPRLSPVPPGLVVHSLTVQPTRVEVTGADRTLADLWVLRTETIDLPPMEGPIQRIVRVIVPVGVRRVDPAQVRVTVNLYRGVSPASGTRESSPPREGQH
jgi:YbbR domain-containing protein